MEPYRVVRRPDEMFLVQIEVHHVDGRRVRQFADGAGAEVTGPYPWDDQPPPGDTYLIEIGPFGFDRNYARDMGAKWAKVAAKWLGDDALCLFS